MSNLLSVDIGKKRTGLCLCLDGIILPQKPIKTNELEKVLKKYILDYDIKKIIFGVPLDKDGKDNEMSLWIKDLVGKIETFGADRIFFNERLTTKESERLIKDSGLKEKKEKIVDSISAMIIMKEYLNFERER
ncbi:MAG: Holliday junction resolvase RuvX [bacterium]|uniref:Putative pre-16S rRNA nuclease n=2 Tax=Bacteria candidate phyla TaxID=1783234 RepID=A0A101I2I0_UNCT6|nr:MAG: Putative Holliday junction resolvase [candidate division TA06 bacterium 32_111]KUK87259.1 MAG: Putative Holliday junction resolvase [candidate division TA06 bacterium 34_109]MDI6700483.1 Holliday junction resolvase RuvX [bacterium]HAF07607.1 Holliday junction resolvase RuvX [candidate division WOR-3 bacterium]HCP16158.1 Holliday junction resolvase RuvX [candidate division WOR-3 bacterium]